MTLYLDVAAAGKLVGDIGIETFLSDLTRYLDEDFRRWKSFDMVARTASHFPYGVIELMPITDGNLYAFKYVNGHPANIEKGFSTVMSFGVLAEAATGLPLLLGEFTLMTALRTAATSVLAAKALARKNSHSMTIIGTGAQSEFQALAFKSLLGISEIRIFDVDAAAVAKFIRNLGHTDGLKVIAAKSAREAVVGADIVTTATADKKKAAILTADMIEPGMHINAIGGDCPGKTELHPGVLEKGRVFVEYELQTRIEGDIQQMPKDFPVTELWRVLIGDVQGRRDDKEITIFDSVGFALEDFSTLRYMYDVAQRKQAGKKLDLIPSLSDPKDLFAILQPVMAPMKVPPMKVGVPVTKSKDGGV